MTSNSLTIPSKLKRISKKEKRSLLARALKANEEAGELSAEVLKLEGEKGRNGKTEKEVREHLWLEAIDTLTVCMDILVATGATQKKIDEIFNQQMDKWEAKMKTERIKENA